MLAWHAHLPPGSQAIAVSRLDSKLAGYAPARASAKHYSLDFSSGRSPARKSGLTQPGTGQSLDAGSNSDTGYGTLAPAIDDRQYTVFCGPGSMTYESHALKEEAMIDILVLVVLLRYTGENIALFSGGLFTGATIYISLTERPSAHVAAPARSPCSRPIDRRPDQPAAFGTSGDGGIGCNIRRNCRRQDHLVRGGNNSRPDNRLPCLRRQAHRDGTEESGYYGP